jgi:hypothetical protein
MQEQILSNFTPPLPSSQHRHSRETESNPKVPLHKVVEDQ